MHPGKKMEALVQAVEADPEDMIYSRPRSEMEALVEALEAHPEVLNYQRHLKQNHTNEDVKNIWKRVADQINAHRIFKSVLSVEDAKKKWADLKYRTKKKAKALKNAQSETGEMPNDDFRAYLTLVEERVMDLIRSERPLRALTTSQISSVPSSHINAPTITQNSSVSSSHINASTPSLDSVLPSGHVIIQAQSSPINSSLQSGHIIVHASTPSTLPSGHILIQATTPILSIPTSTSILPDQFPNLSAHTPILTPDPNLPAPDPILTEVSTVQTAQSIKEEMFEIGEVETEPPLDDIMDEINNISTERVLSKNTKLNNFYSKRKSKTFFIKKQKRVKKTEFDMLADIEERKMALLEEQIKLRRKHLKFQEKKTLIMEQQLAISKEQLAVSKEQLAVSKQILSFRINKGS